MNSPRSIDSKREEFRKYLENAGIMDTFTRILTLIYENEEKPADALQFVRDQFVQSSPINIELQLLQKYVENAKERISSLENEQSLLKNELEKYKAMLAQRQEYRHSQEE